MKSMLKLLMVSAFALLISVPAALAQIPEVSTLPIDEPTDVGGTILQPGTYTIRVLKRGDDNRVQILSPDLKTVYATVLTVPHQLEPNEEVPNTTFVFYPAGEGQPRALRTWFPSDPASEGGRDIVYEETRAKQLARLASAPVVSYRTEIVDDTPLNVVAPDATIETYTWTPAPAPPPVTLDTTVDTTATIETPMMSQSTRTETTAVEMPRTAGRTPLVALLGLLAIAAAVVIRIARQA